MFTMLMTPDVVTGPPEKVRPVDPPLTSTEVTVPAPGKAAQVKALPVHLRNVSVETGADIKLVVSNPVWNTT